MLVDPAWSVEPGDSGWSLARDGRRLRVELDGPESLKRDLREVPYHPDYGVELTTRRLVWHVDGELPLRVRWRVGRS